MPPYRKKPVVVEACQWLKNGDHPAVRPFRRLSVPGDTQCRCGRMVLDHGWIDTLEGGHAVCPADWVITGVKGEFYPCKPDIFEVTYEPVTDAPSDEDLIRRAQEQAERSPGRTGRGAP